MLGEGTGWGRYVCVGKGKVAGRAMKVGKGHAQEVSRRGA